ncbi:MAG: tetratricopeptide repeat protein [Gammaproteobacteria bacterium]
MRSKGSLKWALGDVQFMLSYFPNHPVALRLATEIAQLMGNPKEADHFYARAVRLYPRTPQSWFLYGLQYQVTGRPEQAVKMYRTAIKLDPGLAAAHYNLGMALLKLGRLDEARAEADRAEALGYQKPGLRKLLEAKGKK